jgi:acyl-coenzyme A thioesterase PaaI-like protein
MTRREDLRALPRREGHNCFGCGPKNECGLRMKFFTDEKSLFSWVTIPGHLCGWDNLVHGGVLSTVLDEIMGWTAIHFSRKFAVTQKMAIEFHKPVPVAEELRLEGRVIEFRGQREAEVEGRLFRGEDTLCVQGSGTFRLFSPDAMIRLGAIKEEALTRFDSLLDP